MPEIQSKLVQEVLKENYDFGFATVDHKPYEEKELEDAINRKHGDETLMVAQAMRALDPSTGKAITFRNSILHDRRSPFYTTDIKDVIKVK